PGERAVAAASRRALPPRRQGARAARSRLGGGADDQADGGARAGVRRALARRHGSLPRLRGRVGEGEAACSVPVASPPPPPPPSGGGGAASVLLSHAIAPLAPPRLHPIHPQKDDILSEETTSPHLRGPSATIARSAA